MPLDVDFRIPFPHRCSPDLDRTRAHNLDWLRGHCLITSDEEADRYLSTRMAEAVAYAYPDARGADLDLATDLNAWFVVCDDLFGDPQAALAPEADDIVHGCARVLEGATTTEPAHPVVRALDDVCTRVAHGMSTSWCREFRDGLGDFLRASREEALRGTPHTPLTVQEYRELRMRSIATRTYFAFTQRTGHFELPALVLTAPAVVTLQNLGHEIVAFINDVYSLEVEEHQGYPHNMITVIQHERGCSRADACAAVLAEIRTLTQHFITEEAALPRLCEELGLNAAHRRDVTRYVQGIRDVIAATRDWSPLCSRYHTDQLAASGHRGRSGLRSDAAAAHE
nr:hypothetical protein [Kibdelosporangium sp. MJ126-NF4]CEL13417.1 Pentalenene synthase (PS) (Sesquiterpene synthase) (Sesquiterpene cyclase) [Kibdelosporangium sp. MJ126-NF4]CTQ99106.1 Pentalenene synthase (EC 4.2.3.7) (PS) (Sesquiterpene synthase) (Sesquiterpene cyclase) [Kibdelosporangium sp. MJ126-NF4]